MTTKEIQELTKVIEINPDSTNIIFIDRKVITLETASELAKAIGKANNADFGYIVMTHGDPNEAVKLVSAKDLKK